MLMQIAARLKLFAAHQTFECTTHIFYMNKHNVGTSLIYAYEPLNDVMQHTLLDNDYTQILSILHPYHFQAVTYSKVR